MSFKGVSSASSESFEQKIKQNTFSRSEARDKESQVPIPCYETNDNMAVTRLKHHFAHSSMQGMIINDVIFAKVVTSCPTSSVVRAMQACSH